MTMYFSTQLTRAEDAAPLGDIACSKGLLKIRRSCEPLDLQVESTPLGITLPKTSLDEAVAWIEQHAYLPHAQDAPFHQGVYGPLLAQWGGARVVGCVQVQNPRLAPGMDPISVREGTVLAAQTSSGQVFASLGRMNHAWWVVVQESNLVRQDSPSWDEALALFQVRVMNTLDCSMHQKMTFLADTGFAPRATGFLAARDRVQDGQPHPFSSRRPATDRPARLSMAYVHDATGVLGSFFRDADGVHARRHRGDFQAFDSLDAGMHWMTSRT